MDKNMELSDWEQVIATTVAEVLHQEKRNTVVENVKVTIRPGNCLVAIKLSDPFLKTEHTVEIALAY